MLAMVPAQRASIRCVVVRMRAGGFWIPAFAGMTGGGAGMTVGAREREARLLAAFRGPGSALAE